MTAHIRNPRVRRARGPARAGGALVAALVCLIGAGCARHSKDSLLADGDARRTPDPIGVERPVVSASGPPLEINPVPVTVAGDVTAGTLDVSAEEVEANAGDPPTPAEPARRRGTSELVDAKVGEINGKPIYASDFFEDTDGPGERLRQKAREKGITREAWLTFASERIALRLHEIQQDELFEAEARASLKPPQRQGLRAFVEEIGERQRRSSGGSRTAAERKLQQTYNMTYEEFLRDRESRVLIETLLAQKIDPRVFVTFRDIQRYYEKNIKEFRPDPRARFRQIRVPSAQSEAVRSVQEALDSGTPFGEVARWEVNTVASRDQGGLEERILTGPREEADLFGTVTELNEAARTLAPGDWTRTPLTYGAWTSWLYLESIEVIDRPLTDEQVQLQITETLRARKRQEVANSYLRRLAERASLGDLPEIHLRLLQIADIRYWRTR